MEIIWQEIYRRYVISKPLRYDCNYFHASPGIGKTYLFNQLSLKNKDDVPNIYANFQNKVQFVGITFNSDTTYTDTENELSFQHLFWSRVIYTEFIDHSIAWDSFFDAYIKMIKNDAISSDVCLQMLINKYKTKEMFVFLIDEITKISDKKRRDDVTSYICRLQDHNEPIKKLAIFSTLDPDIIQGKFTDESERAVKAITQLNLFSIKDSMNFLDKILDEKGIEIMEGYNKTDDFIKQRVLMFLSTLSSGHPRSLESFIIAIETALKSTSRIGIALKEIFKLALSYLNYPNLFSNIDIVNIACLGDNVNLNDKVFVESNTQTIYDLITRGVILASLNQVRMVAKNIEVPPKIPLLILYYWANLNCDKERIANILANIFKLSYDWTSDSFDEFHGHWETLFRTLNHNKKLYKSISIYNYYKNPKIVINKTGLLDQKIDLSNDLEIFSFGKEFKITDIDINKVYLPKDKQNSGFDSLIFVKVNKQMKKGKNTYFALFLQNKISDVDKNTSLVLSEIKKSIKNSKIFLNKRISKSDSVEIIPVYIFLSMRSIQEQLIKLNLPEVELKHKLNELENEMKVKNNLKSFLKKEDNIMILDESDLEKLYGVNLFQIPFYLRTSALSKDIVFRFKSNLRE